MLINNLINLFQWLFRAIGLYTLVQCVLVGWLWLFYDLPLTKIRKKLHNIPKERNKQNRGKGILQAEQERQIAIQKRPLEAELELKDYNRKIFIDRIHLISIIKFK